jgi:lysophospholipase L1-like esterase
MKAEKILLFVCFVIALLMLVSLFFPEDGIPFGERRLFFPSLEEVMVREKSRSVDEKMGDLEEKLQMKIQQDSISELRMAARNDSAIFYTNFLETHPAKFYLPQNDITFFDSLFLKMNDCRDKNETIHILHYGDSQIEGDRITGYIRQKFQEKFGGNGPGLIPVVQMIPSSSVGQSSSGNFVRYTVAGNHATKAPHKRYGIMGQTTELNGSGSMTVTSRNWSVTYDNVKEFSRIRLFLSHNSPNFKATLLHDNAEPMVQTLADESSHSRVLTWKLTNPIKQFTLQFSGSAELTGVSIDGNQGVAVDNIPLRGSSGTFFSDIDPNSVVPVMKELKVQLILLEFGGNMMPVIKGEKNTLDYKDKMAKQIKHFQSIYPEAKVLFIGPADMSKKVNGHLQSYPFLKETIQRLKESALENGAAYWDMYEVMGGENSMIDWVQNKPALGSPDYIHFTSKGAEKIANLFFESLMIYYDYANFRNFPDIQ